MMQHPSKKKIDRNNTSNKVGVPLKKDATT
jgi:hypothetical protein